MAEGQRKGVGPQLAPLDRAAFLGDLREHLTPVFESWRGRCHRECVSDIQRQLQQAVVLRMVAWEIGRVKDMGMFVVTPAGEHIVMYLTVVRRDDEFDIEWKASL